MFNKRARGKRVELLTTGLKAPPGQNGSLSLHPPQY